MDIQTHSRTRQIKQLSRYLFIALTGFRYLLLLGWPAIVVVAFIPSGSLYLGDALIPIENMSLPFKGGILALYAVGLTIMLRINHHFRALMKQFMQGHIFGPEAIASVRGALHSGMVFFILSWLYVLFGLIYDYSINSELDFSFVTEIAIACIYFGLMYTLLWALEIGADLNEESEKTI
ncbi:hypothetical protein [Alkalimonas amylolytica]|uniref:DUF2975 domain-containing protein n=1 Tax=Alkalimonas amylolytica TaxID=152573 RepID=A0A1H4BHV4_ALKAM|nr:hypothetical protein [Alkalimonas amylolytica]SEA47624.1 hypothetical protein SAMN04488051_103366 [Alkalimonas amylolytica]